MAPPAKLPLLACGLLTLTVTSCIKTRPTVLTSQTISMAAPPAPAMTKAEKAADRADMARRMRSSESPIREFSDPAAGSVIRELASRDNRDRDRAYRNEGYAGHVLNTVEAHILSTDSFDRDLNLRVHPVAAERISAARVVALLEESSSVAAKPKPDATIATVDPGSSIVVPTALLLSPIGSAEGAVVQESKGPELAVDIKPELPVNAVSNRPARPKVTHRKSGSAVKTSTVRQVKSAPEMD